jgi:hypothetical protein
MTTMEAPASARQLCSRHKLEGTRDYQIGISEFLNSNMRVPEFKSTTVSSPVRSDTSDGIRDIIYFRRARF